MDDHQSHMNRTRFTAILFAACFLSYSGCDTGLGPIVEPSGFTGVIRFKNWPTADSVRDLRLVAFDTYPSDSAGIFLALLSGRVAVYPADLTAAGSLPKFVDSVAFTVTTKVGINFKYQQYGYVIVAQLYGPNAFADWRPAGVYTLQPNTFNPAPVFLRVNRFSTNIDILVDFQNPPPKPWR